MQEAKKYKIAVIGGGLAGLTTAYFLQERGFAPTVFEANPEAGGRLSTVQIDGTYINRGALLFAPRLNPSFAALVEELGIETEVSPLSRFALQVGDKITAMNQGALARSGFFTFKEFLLWLRLKRYLKKLTFDFENPSEKLQRLHGISMKEFAYKEAKFNDKLYHFFIQPFVSFAYVDPEEIAADHGLFLFAYATVPLLMPKKGMGEVALALKSKLGEIREKARVTEIQPKSSGGFTVRGERQEQGGFAQDFDICILATGCRGVKKLAPQIDFEVYQSKTRGAILEADCNHYKKYDILLLSKFNNTHGVHGGELRHRPGKNTLAGFFLYHPQGDWEPIVGHHQILEEVGWSPAISVMTPGCKVPDVSTKVPGLYMVGDFYRYPCVESCVVTARKAAECVEAEVKSRCEPFVCVG
jgi:phytoene dehydrogenase-like protein